MSKLKSFDEFIKEKDGQYVEVAGSANAKNQCVDLVNAYIRDVLGLPIVEWTNARDFPSKLTNLPWIPSTPTNVPKKGDILVWQHDQWGHIGIFIEGDVNTFISFDQNYPTGSPAHKQKHNYNKPKLAGWLEAPKKEEKMPISNENEIVLLNLLKKYGLEVKSDKSLKDRLQELDMKLNENVGLNWGKTEEGGGHLGNARRRIVSLEKDIQNLKESTGIEIKRETTVAGIIGEVNGWDITKGPLKVNYKVIR